jgi:hypothetical protein
MTLKITLTIQSMQITNVKIVISIIEYKKEEDMYFWEHKITTIWCRDHEDKNPVLPIAALILDILVKFVRNAPCFS